MDQAITITHGMVGVESPTTHITFTTTEDMAATGVGTLAIITMHTARPWVATMEVMEVMVG